MLRLYQLSLVIRPYKTMKVSNICKIIAGAMSLSVIIWCSDTWNDHFDVAGTNGSESLLRMVETNPQLSDFHSVLKATHVYNNNHRTGVTFADLLDADQALTVWAPINGAFPVDSLLRLCQTEKGDSVVGHRFVMNHIAHHLYNMNGLAGEHVKMLNDKLLLLNGKSLAQAQVEEGQYNLPATNGLLHVVGDEAQYTYNVYEGLTSLDEFSHVGGFLSRFEHQELDEEHSIQSGIVDGKKIYSDSVMVKENALFRVFDQIISEDSTFVMLVPDRATWNPVYQSTQRFFDYGSIEKADSISEYWTYVSLLRDLVFNKNMQRSEVDSVFSTSYTPAEWPYHVFYKPYAAGGVLDIANVKDTLECSNGAIYRMKHWQFSPEDLFFHPIVTQGEREASIIDYKDCTLNYRSAIADSISGNGYVDIVPRNSNSNWSITYEIRNTLSGTYDIYAVILPKTVADVNSRNDKPNKFVATLSYVDEKGKKQTESFGTPVSNDGVTVDTVLIGRFTFPVCNYGQQDATVSLQLKCNMRSSDTAYHREMFLDCIYLKPVSDEDEALAEEAKTRKEVQK